MSLTPDGPRYDSKPDQPRDPGVMSFAEYDRRCDELLEDKNIVQMIWEVVCDLSETEQAEIVQVLFRSGNNASDFTEAGRLLHKHSHKRVTEMLDNEII